MASKGDPDANTHLPSVAATASSKVHSARLVGLDSGMTIGLRLTAAISFRTRGEKAPGDVETPTSAVGLRARTAENKSWSFSFSPFDLFLFSSSWGSPACAKGSLWCASSPAAALSAVTKPLESMNTHRRRACSLVIISAPPLDDDDLFWIAAATSSPMPTPASPAP